MGAKRENNPAGENASSSFDWFLADQDREKVDKEEKESKKSSQGIFFCVWTTCYSALNVTILCDRRFTMYLGEDEIGRRKKRLFPPFFLRYSLPHPPFVFPHSPVEEKLSSPFSAPFYWCLAIDKGSTLYLSRRSISPYILRVSTYQVYDKSWRISLSSSRP